MTNWTGRDLEVDFSFLPAGTFWLEAYQDGVNADRVASDYKKTKTQISNTKAENNSRSRRRLGPRGFTPSGALNIRCFRLQSLAHLPCKQSVDRGNRRLPINRSPRSSAVRLLPGCRQTAN